MSAHFQGKKVCTKIYMNFMLISNRRSWRTPFTMPFRFVYRTAGISALSRSLDIIERDISCRLHKYNFTNLKGRIGDMDLAQR